MAIIDLITEKFLKIESFQDQDWGVGAFWLLEHFGCFKSRSPVTLQHLNIFKILYVYNLQIQ